MSDNINNEQNEDMDVNQDASDQANALAGGSSINAGNSNAIVDSESPTDEQSIFSDIVDYYLLNENVPQLPIAFTVNMTHQIETGKPITISFTGQNFVTVNTASSQVGIAHGSSHTVGRVHVEILSPGPDSLSNPSYPMASAEFRCGICLVEINQLVNIRATTCGHVFCDSCLQQALSENSNCPKCSVPQEYERSTRLFWS